MSTPATPRKPRLLKRGAFLKGMWHCDCEPRVPADQFKTKNGGKNHGRWFYTCQKPQHKRCGFFLWADDAKIREESAVLNNATSEPRVTVAAAPETPRKRDALGTTVQVVTPNTESRAVRTGPAPSNPGSRQKADDAHAIKDEDEFEWSSGADEDLVEATKQVETPRKTPRTAVITSPGKTSGIRPLHLTPSPDDDDDDVFTTPTTNRRTANHHNTSLISPTHDDTSSQPPNLSSLPAQALHILSPIPLPSTIQSELTALLTQFELRLHGAARGRDLTRLAVQNKEKRIAELQARIHGLENERETLRTVVGHMKSDMATSPKSKRGRRPDGNVERTRSEV